MILNSEAKWVFDKSPHTGRPKTVHCIPVLPDDRMLCKPSGEIDAVLDSGIETQGWRPRVRFKVGGEYCVKSEQRAPALGRIVVEMVVKWELLVMDINALIRAKACGYDGVGDLLLTWAYRHDHKFYKDEILHYLDDESKSVQVWDALRRRPDHLYTAWAITFTPVAS